MPPLPTQSEDGGGKGGGGGNQVCIDIFIKWLFLLPPDRPCKSQMGVDEIHDLGDWGGRDIACRTRQQEFTKRTTIRSTQGRQHKTGV